MDLNKSVPVAPVPFGSAQTALVDAVRANYPSDQLNMHSHTFCVKSGTFKFRSALFDFPGFKSEVLDRNQFVEVKHLVLRSTGWKSGSYSAVALTMNASASTDVHDITANKTAAYRRVTDLTMGMEEHQLPMVTGMSSIILPNNISGRHIYFVMNATEGNYTLQIYYTRGAGAVSNSSQSCESASA